MTPHKQLAGMNDAKSRSTGAVSALPIHVCAINGAAIARQMLTMELITILYTKHPERTQRTVPGLFFPNSSAVRYIEPVRIPAMENVVDNPPTERISCRRPVPDAPNFEVMNT